MQKNKTQRRAESRAGLQGVFNFEHSPSSPSLLKYQLSNLCRYHIDGQSLVEPVWSRHHG